MSQYGPNYSVSRTGHTTFGPSQFNSTFNQRNMQRFDRRDVSTLSSAGTNMFANPAAQIRKSANTSVSVHDPYQARQSNSVQMMNNSAYALMQGRAGHKMSHQVQNKNNWKKAIDKFSPKKSTQLNEVSMRF